MPRNTASEHIVQSGFITGIIAPTLLARTDLQRYDQAATAIDNFIIDYQAGLKRRPGTIFTVPVPADSKCFTFEIGDTDNDVLVLLSPLELRLIQNGAYLLEATQAVSSFTGGDTFVFAAPHGYVVGDIVVPDGVTGVKDIPCIVTAVPTTSSIKVDYLINGAVPASGSPAGTFAKSLTFTTPYTAADIPDVNYFYNLSEAVLSHPDYQQRSLTRTGAGWALDVLEDGPSISPPANISASASTSGSAYQVYTVTAIDGDGNESSAGRPYLLSSAVNIAATSGYIEITWDAVADAEYYRIYASSIVESFSPNLLSDTGYIGETRDTRFINDNIVQDFTLLPQVIRRPFTPGNIFKIDVTAGGSGYTENGATISITTSTGSEFVGYPIVVSGAIVSVFIVDGGKGYDSGDTVVFGGAGTGATGTIDSLSPDTGLFPAVSTRFQTRRVNAGADALPLTLQGSQPNRVTNFNAHRAVIDSDAFSHTIDASTVSPIRALVPMRSSLMVLHAKGVDRVYGGENIIVTPSIAIVERQTTLGVSSIPPQLVSDDLLYFTIGNNALYSMAYTFSRNAFEPSDRSILAPHLFTLELSPVRMEWAETPDKLIWVIRSDGRLLSLTYAKDQEVFAWATHWTQGMFKDVAIVTENNNQVPYFIIERSVNGSTVHYLEKLAPSRFHTSEEYHGTDSSLMYEGSKLAGNLTIVENAGTLSATITSTTTSFSGASEGDVIRAACGVYVITSVDSSSVVTCNIIQEGMPLYETTLPTVLSGSWDLTTPVSSVSGLDHLEGELVTIVADGSRLPDQTVSSGSITLTSPATRIVIGKSFTARAEIVPLFTTRTVSEGVKKTILEARVRVDKTLGLEVGMLGQSLYPLPTDLGSEYGDIMPLMTGIREAYIRTGSVYDAQVVFQSSQPFPATVLGFSVVAGLGDYD